MTMTRDEFAERLQALKHEDWPRFRISHIDPEPESASGKAILAAAADPEHAEIIDAYLRHYVPGDCPGCGFGRFGWGIAHGAGSCICGWPARLYHYITDNRDKDDLICHATCNGYRVCSAPRGDHQEEEIHGFVVRTGEPVTHIELRCPDPTAPPGCATHGLPFRSEYRPPIVVEFSTLLWAHPYDLHVPAEQAVAA